MSKLTIAVDLAKDVFEIAVATPSGKVIERKRLTRPQFERFWQTREPCAVVMEACGSAHHWARTLIGLGFEVRLLPAHYVRLYRQRNRPIAPTATRCSKPPAPHASRLSASRARTSRRSSCCTG
jgi:transposase